MRSAAALRRSTFRVLASLASVLGCLPQATGQGDWREDVGVYRMGATFAGVPTGVGTLSLVESPIFGGANNYLPDAANASFVGKNLVNKGPGTGTSFHATTVGQFFFGSPDSLLSSPADIHAYNASYWLETNFLGFNTPNPPLVETARVQNHSWDAAGNLGEALVAEIDQRLDFAIQRDGFVAVAGARNLTSTSLPALFVQAYNHITVGVSHGGHSAGFTSYDGVGRIKPDLVAPGALTSYAAPKVSTTAGVLIARAMASPHSLTGADLPRVVKALLLAGATKEEYPAWARTTNRPLDLRYGAGELNTFLSYRMLQSGRAGPSASGLVPETGWAADSLNGGAQKTFFFEIPAGTPAGPFSVALTWHRLVTDGNSAPDTWFPSPLALVNLDLALHHASGFTVGAQLDLSSSPVDNVEHIYAAALAPGRYALVVTSPSGGATTDYALAWRATPGVSVTATGPEAREADGAAGGFTLTRHGSTATPLLVPLVAGGDAVPGSHYTPLPASVLIPAGSASVTVAVAPVSDALAQGDRTVTLAVAGDYSLAAADPNPAVVVLRDKPFDAWRFVRFSSMQLGEVAISGATADPDGDGLANLTEYALDGRPMEGDAFAVAPTLRWIDETEPANRRLELNYVQPVGRTDLRYEVEWTADLSAPWQAGPGVVMEAAREPQAGGERVTVRATAPLGEQPRQFFRLRVTRF